MPGLPLGWATDVAVLEHSGSTVDDRGDHLVVRTRGNPTFQWGNCIFVTDRGAVDDADRWIRVFHEAVPDADWVAIGLVSMPAAVDGWARHAVDLELDDVLATDTLPTQTTAPIGYDVRALVGEDWEQLVTRELTFDDHDVEPHAHEQFVRARVHSQRELTERGLALFAGAFFDGRLVAELGIVRCGTTARYQNVGTAPEHQSRGIASHLVGVAAAWAADRGCERWVIVTEASNPAGRVYRRAGFVLAAPSVQAYRKPAH